MTINLPNTISLARLALAPIFFVMLNSESKSLVSIACVIYLVAAITDTLDGWAARRFGVVTRWGEFLDPLADKVLTLFAFVSFVAMGIMPLWMLIIFLVRDTISTTLRVIAIKQGSPVETSISAKVKTTIQMFFIGYVLSLIFLKNNFEIFNPVTIDRVIYSKFTFYAVLLVTLMALYSVFGYIKKYKSLFLAKNFIKKYEKTLDR
jgi:CDP-diacylglycerol--glycerol-3-phosphate 3-phosphatidyltransferase